MYIYIYISAPGSGYIRRPPGQDISVTGPHVPSRYERHTGATNPTLGTSISALTRSGSDRTPPKELVLATGDDPQPLPQCSHKEVQQTSRNGIRTGLPG